MINILLTGVGGQGTVLAAKLLAQAAQDKGWNVRSAETIGMAQRGGGVVSHVRIGDQGEQIHSPLLAAGTADLIIAFEPAEAARAIPYLAPHAALVTATSAIQPVTAALSKDPYQGSRIIARLKEVFKEAGKEDRLVLVDDASLTQEVGTTRVLNTILLAVALNQGAVPLTVDDLRQAIRVCVKPQFIDLNLHAIEVAVA